MLLLCVPMLCCGGFAAAQVNTASLSGTVLDPQGRAVKNAKVTLASGASATQRAVTADDEGRYNIVGIPPGRYKMTVDGGANFSVYENEAIVLTVGETAVFDPHLELQGVRQTITVNAESVPVETTKTEVSQTVEQQRIDNLPINGRNYINFTLTNSQTTRDVAPTIGPAPNSGLNVNGSRARANIVSVDGADAVDNSVNGVRATVSQEAVQEFQLILSNYNAEYGRATGGVINIVTKSGTNEFHGDAFGYFRNKAFQARNAFSGEVDPATGSLVPIKQAYTRTQSGLTFGGPIQKDKTFVFFSYEYTQREESGFSSVGEGNFGVSPYSCGGCALTGLLLTPGQASAVTSLLGEAQALAAANQFAQAAALQKLAGGYAAIMGSASNVALFGVDPGLVATNFGFPVSPGAHFPVPVTCPFGQVIGTVNCTAGHAVQAGATFGYGLASLPASFVPLSTIGGNFPVKEKTSLWSARLDHHWDNNNNSFLRVGVSPSLATGIESTSQNQVFGQNAGSRTGLNQSRDLDFVFQHDTIVSPAAFNEFRLQVARRGLHFGFSDLPGGGNIGVNIPGYAYFGREPFSTVDRIERRFEFTDNVSLVRGRHTFKIGGDFNLLQLRSKKAQIFELDFGGDVNFGGIAASSFVGTNCVGGTGPACTGGIALPGATGLQAYGLGDPTTYIQGIGNSNDPFDNIPIGLFFQDSWRATRKLTLNYGLRYDVEISPLFAPATAINAAAEKALGVTEGIPRNYKNFAPRFGLAWDPRGDGKTVIRAGYGIFYDHPLLAVAFDAATADGGRSVQLLSAGGTASACGLVTAPCGNNLDGVGNLNGSSIFQGALNALPNMFYLPNQQRFDPLAAGSIFANQNYLTAGFPLPILPFTLPVASNFKYGYAQQGNLTVERQIAGSWKISAGYQWTRGIHLNRPVDVNSTDPQLLANNLLNADAAGLGFTSPVTVQAPSASFAANTNGPNTCGVNVIAPSVLGVLTGCPVAALNGQFVGTPAFFNFFRKSGPNPSFAAAAGGYANEVGLAHLAGYPTGFGVPVPFNSVDAQLSNGNSWYNALTVNVSKRFTKTFEMLSSYTWSHSIDDSTDLQSTLEPQDSRFPNNERSNSDNDQRHRWVTSAVFQSTPGKSGDGFFKQFIGNFTVAPIIELSSGRPYNVITGEDTRLDLGASEARPSIGAGTTSPYIPGKSFAVANVCLSNAGTPFAVPGISPFAGCDGNLGRNAFLTPGFFEWDMRVSKRIPIGERFKLDVIADAFNLFNRTNIAAVNQLCDPSAGPACTAGQPTSAYDARQFQFALKMSW
jgi:hypothetical protein